MTTKGLLKLRKMSEAKYGYSRMMYISYRRDLTSGLPCIKEGEDVVELCRGYSLHDGGGGEKGVVLVYLLHMRAYIDDIIFPTLKVQPKQHQ